MKTIVPRVTLVGAGPGDAELITVKGLNAIREADVILYDALISRDILKHAPLKAKRVYVGKRAGHHALSQDGINRLIIEMAHKHGHVVRVKGGDPIVFGRGHEEFTYVRSFDIPVELIPGVSSAVALPGLQGIPLTKRGVSDSFWVLTATKRGNQMNPDLLFAAQTNATVVVLMGMKKLADIVELYQLYNKGDTPIGIIQNGTLPTENLGLGRIDNILDVVDQEGLGAPAIIVIGEVVAEHRLAELNLIAKSALSKVPNPN